ncbi:hypothetical protein UPYG_G00055310 [Umbra pygmaea]|uniref:MICAL-like protein 2 n=1 Tax=Umbra pygmaea TaxID=75934 RepID=A0ABD0XT31_UMBPY
MSAVKALQQWCKIQCEGYRDVTITNMTTSFRDGMAFCALIHRNRPDLIKYDSLNKENVYENNHLAFRVAEDKLGIPALLDAEDMVALKVPDRLSVLTYVSQYYNYFHGKSPIGGMAGIKRPAEPSREEPSGKKNQAVISKVFPSTPSSKPATENRLPPSSPKAAPRAQQMDVSPSKTRSSNCCVCDKHVHLVQRHLVDGRLYHRNCAKCVECSGTLLSGNCKPNALVCISHHHQGAPLRDLPQNTASKYIPQTPATPKTTLPSHTETPKVSVTPRQDPIPTYRAHTEPSKHSLTPTITPTNTPTKLSDRPTPPSTTTTPASSQPTSVISSLSTWSPAGPGPVAAPLSSKAPTMASRNQQARLQFFQSGNDPSSTGLENQGKTQEQSVNPPAPSGPKIGTQGAVVGAGQVVGLGGDKARDGVGDKEAGLSGDTSGDKDGVQTKGWLFKLKNKTSPPNEQNKSQAAAFIGKKLLEENNNNKKTTPATASNNKTTTAAASSNKTTITTAAASNSKTTITTPAASNNKTTITTPAASNNKTTITTPAASNSKTTITTPAASNNKTTITTPAASNNKTTITTPAASNSKTTTTTPAASNSKTTTTTPAASNSKTTTTTPAASNSKTTITTPAASNNKTTITTPAASNSKTTIITTGTNNKNTFAAASGPSWQTVELKKTPMRKEVEKTKKEETIRKEAEPVKKGVDTTKKEAEPVKKGAETPQPKVPCGTKPKTRHSVQPFPVQLKQQTTTATLLLIGGPYSNLWQSLRTPPPPPDKQKASAPSGPMAADAGKHSSGTPGSAPPPAPSSSSLAPSPSPPSTGPGKWGSPSGKSTATPGRPKPETQSLKPIKPDYIPKEDILRELQDIENSVTELERTGVELEKKLRRCEEEGVEDVVTDDLMVDWFTLIRNKQVYMRRESELVYIAKTQDLEEQQPSVELELRRLMEKPDHLKTFLDRRREKELMEKLVEIVNDRNAIVDGLDEDRLREEEEDEELNKMMKTLDVQKDKKKRKSSFKFWGNKKEG